MQKSAGLFLIRQFFLSRYSLTRPVIDAAKFHNVGVTQRHQLFRCLLAAVAAAAVYQDQLILVRKLRNLRRADGLVGDVDGAGDMPVRKFLRGANSRMMYPVSSSIRATAVSMLICAYVPSFSGAVQPVRRSAARTSDNISFMVNTPLIVFVISVYTLTQCFFCDNVTLYCVRYRPALRQKRPRSNRECGIL